MFERFSERARQVVVLAQHEARFLKHNSIGTEHLLLGLVREEEGGAARVLASFEVTLEHARAVVARIVGQGGEGTYGQMPFTPRAKKALEQSLKEALALRHTHIGTEHVLLGVLAVKDGVAVRALRDLDLDPDEVRDAAIAALANPGRFPRRVPRPGGRERFAEQAAEPLPEPAPSADATPRWRDGITRWSLYVALALPAFALGLVLGWLIWV